MKICNKMHIEILLYIFTFLTMNSHVGIEHYFKLKLLCLFGILKTSVFGLTFQFQ